MDNLANDIELVENWMEEEQLPIGLKMSLENVLEAAWRYDDMA